MNNNPNITYHKLNKANFLKNYVYYCITFGVPLRSCSLLGKEPFLFAVFSPSSSRPTVCHGPLFPAFVCLFIQYMCMFEWVFACQARQNCCILFILAHLLFLLLTHHWVHADWPSLPDTIQIMAFLETQSIRHLHWAVIIQLMCQFQNTFL